MRKFLATGQTAAKVATASDPAAMKLSRLFLVVLSTLLAHIVSADNSDTDFNNVAEEFIKGYLTARPLEAVTLGFHEYDGKVNDYTRLSIDAELSRLKRFDDRLKKFDLAKLNTRNGIDLRILQAAISRELFLIQDMAIYERNPMTYARAIDLNVYISRKFAPVEERLRSIIAVEAQAPNILIAGKTNLADNLPRPYIELAVQIARGAADFLRQDLVDAVKDAKDEKLLAAFGTSNRKAIAALNDYANWLEREKLPKATADFALGEEKYHRILRETEFVDLAPSKILEIGLQELKKQQGVFAEAAKTIDPGKPPLQVFKEILNEHPTAVSLVPDVTKNLEQIRKYIVEHKLVKIPSDVRAQVKETPSYRRATSFASMDTPGPFENKATEAYYYVTPVDKDWPDAQKNEWLTAFNTYTANIVTIHEAYPGHYVQFLHLNASSATKIEKIFGSYAFIEGWAHYCEQMMLDEGFGAEKKNKNLPTNEELKRAAKFRMAQADEAMLRLCRLCVSIKLHTQKMSVDEATKFFQDNCYYEAKPARAEAMRGTFDPGYLNYTLGKLQILKMREDYRGQEGDDFSLQKFHNEILDHGMPPVRLLREILLKDKSKWDEVL
jgi:uncharacterized protein (DUF885 family)